jgi:hypothetical protein
MTCLGRSKSLTQRTACITGGILGEPFQIGIADHRAVVQGVAEVAEPTALNMALLTMAAKFEVIHLLKAKFGEELAAVDPMTLWREIDATKPGVMRQLFRWLNRHASRLGGSSRGCRQ